MHFTLPLKIARHRGKNLLVSCNALQWTRHAALHFNQRKCNNSSSVDGRSSLCLFLLRAMSYKSGDALIYSRSDWDILPLAAAVLAHDDGDVHTQSMHRWLQPAWWSRARRLNSYTAMMNGIFCAFQIASKVECNWHDTVNVWCIITLLFSSISLHIKCINIILQFIFFFFIFFLWIILVSRTWSDDHNLFFFLVLLLLWIGEEWRRSVLHSYTHIHLYLNWVNLMLCNWKQSECEIIIIIANRMHCN